MWEFNLLAPVDDRSTPEQRQIASESFTEGHAVIAPSDLAQCRRTSTVRQLSLPFEPSQRPNPSASPEPRPPELQFPLGDINVCARKAQPMRRRKGRKSMKRRRGQNGTVVIQAGWYRVRFRQDVAGQDERVYMSEKVAPVVIDKAGNPKPPSPEVQRLAREVVERSGANSKEHFEHAVLGAETLRERAERWLLEVQHRRFGKYKATTLGTIRGALRKHIYPIIGHLPLAQVNNKSCKPLVESMFNGT
jgi:hypothetical protein